MAAEGDRIVTYIFTGEEGRDEDDFYIIPQNITHLLFHESITSIPGWLCREHPNIVEVYCHVGVRRIEMNAFFRCPRLKRLIIPGVEVVEACAFSRCEAITDIDCPKLERIGQEAFAFCKSLRNINLPSAKIVESTALACCKALTDAKFGKNLESIGGGTFIDCPSLERITIPLKDGLITGDVVFQCCDNLRHVDLVEGAVLRATIDALLLEEWRNDMNEEIDSINQILPNARAGFISVEGNNDEDGEKAIVIREWMSRVLRKIVDYKAQHRLLSNEAASILQLVLPNDIVMSNVIPFIELPLHTFEGEDHEDEGGEG